MQYPEDLYLCVVEQGNSDAGGIVNYKGVNYKIIESPPNTQKVSGIQKEMYCSQAGVSFLYYKENREEKKEQQYYHYKKSESGNLSDHMAYSFYQVKDNPDKEAYYQALIWMDTKEKTNSTDYLCDTTVSNYLNFEKDYNKYLGLNSQEQEKEEKDKSTLFKHYDSFKKTMEN